mmetsp:Transcript_9567/g.20737  ORF Transcript_9567/g.20737 Transcript_9567/m.20737 type:complete len:87 (-) Transcript_9567:1750-2010(-)
MTNSDVCSITERWRDLDLFGRWKTPTCYVYCTLCGGWTEDMTKSTLEITRQPSKFGLSNLTFSVGECHSHYSHYFDIHTRGLSPEQ